MTNRLKQYFPMLRTRTEIMEIIIKDETLKTLFDSWETEFQEEFLNICTGISGVKVLYNFMIKEILNPEAVPERIGELEDGSIANIEIQKIGYQFPGERCACYSSDLLLRQYKRIKGMQKRKFTYKSIKNVYTIVFFEKSPKTFHKFPQNYLHFF